MKVKRNLLLELLKKPIPYHSTFQKIEEKDEQEDQLTHQIIEIIADLKKMNRSIIYPQSSLQFDLELDSFDRLNLKLQLEETFKLKQIDSKIFSSERVRDVVKAVQIAGYDKSEVKKQELTEPRRNTFTTIARTLDLSD